MLERVISGGQTGADQAGWRAAKAAGIPTGGAMPKGFLTEQGPRPEFAELYGAHELSTASYPLRTDVNVRDSQVTLWFGDPHSRGGQKTIQACQKWYRGVLVIPLQGRVVRPSEVVEWLTVNNIRVLNVAGNRESTEPGIGKRVERFLGVVFKMLARDGSAAP